MATKSFIFITFVYDTAYFSKCSIIVLVVFHLPVNNRLSQSNIYMLKCVEVRVRGVRIYQYQTSEKP